MAAVDCGTPINPNLARVQTEGGIAQGIGMALFEEVQYTEKKAKKVRNNSLMQYKIPTREDFGNIRVAFESSYEESGPFGAKSIGELVIDTPCPAIAEAIYNATGVRVRELPITPEKVAMGILKKKLENKMSIILKGILALFWLLLVPAAIGILVMSKRKDICPEACLPFGYLLFLIH